MQRPKTIKEVVDLGTYKAGQMMIDCPYHSSLKENAVRERLAGEICEAVFVQALDVLRGYYRPEAEDREILGLIQARHTEVIPRTDETYETIGRARRVINAVGSLPESDDSCVVKWAFFDLIKLANEGIRNRGILERIDKARSGR